MAEVRNYTVTHRVTVRGSSEFDALRTGAEEMKRKLNSVSESQLGSLGLDVDLEPWIGIEISNEE